MSSKDLLIFANKWVLQMYSDLLKSFGKTWNKVFNLNKDIFIDGMTVEEILYASNTYGLGFQTWRIMKNEDKHWDEDCFDENV